MGLGWSASASAVAPSDPSSAQAEPPPPEIAPLALAQRRDYSFLLGTTYALAPFLALAVGGALAESEADDTVAVLGGASMFLLPSIVHIGYGNQPHGSLAFLELAGVTTLGIFVGGSVGYAISYGSCPDHDSDDCDFAGLPGLIVGSLIGGVTGYTIFAVYDVATNASVLAKGSKPRSPKASLQLWMQPVPARRSVAGDDSSSWDGFQLGATLRM